MSVRIDPDSFGFLLVDASRLMRQEIDRRIAQAGLGLTPGEVRALSHAARAGTVRQSVLAEAMGVEAMTLSSYLDRLESQGFVVRTADPDDRRAKLVHLTDTADELLQRMREIGIAARQIASAGMNAEEWETLQALLKRVRANLGEGRDAERRSSAA